MERAPSLVRTERPFLGYRRLAEMISVPLTSPETALALRRVAGTARRNARFAAWALETFDGDQPLAAAALLDETRLAGLESMIERWRARPEHAAEALELWSAVLAAHQRLLEMHPPAPRPPREITEWIHQRLGLRADASETGRIARKMGRGGVPISLFCAQPDIEAHELADRLALAVGAFPIGLGWRPSTPQQAETDLAYALSHDLAYGTVLMTHDSATARARRFLAACGGGLVLTNSTALSSNGSSRERGRSWAPITNATMDYAIASLGTERAGIVIVTGED